MQPVTIISGQMASLPRANIDTDHIIPKQFLKRVERSGFGPFLFWDWAQDAEGELYVLSSTGDIGRIVPG